MIGTTRSRVSYFMNKFRQAGFIDYNGHLKVHSSLLSVVLADPPRSVDLYDQPRRYAMYSKKPKQRAGDDKCTSCRGIGVIVVSNPANPERRQPPVCPRCGGTGRAPYGQRQAIRAP
jgi:hypothetical protein